MNRLPVSNARGLKHSTHMVARLTPELAKHFRKNAVPAEQPLSKPLRRRDLAALSSHTAQQNTKSAQLQRLTGHKNLFAPAVPLLNPCNLSDLVNDSFLG